MAEGITREEYNQSLARIHDRIEAIEKTGTRIEVTAQLMKESVDKICECVYGNDRTGLTQKITQLFERISLHTKLITFLVLSVMSIAFCIIKKLFL